MEFYTTDDIKKMPFPAKIEEVELHSPVYGRAIVFTVEGHEYHVCMVCGSAHPMNSSALSFELGIEESVADERISDMNGLEWDNTMCEQRHPPAGRREVVESES